MIERKHDKYCLLHGHSAFSIGDGVAKIPEIVAKCKELKIPAVGLTEHGNMFSFYKFYREAIKNSIKPISGCEFYVNNEFYANRERFLDSQKKSTKKKDELFKEENFETTDEEDFDLSEYATSHITCYAKNYDGLNNLIHLSNVGFFNFYKKPLVSNSTIFEELNENNVVTTGCLASQFSKKILSKDYAGIERTLKKFKDKFGDDFYIELHLNELREQQQVYEYYRQNYEKLGLKFSLALDYHYVDEKDWEIQYLIYLIKSGKTVNTMTQEQWFYKVRNLYIKSIDEIYDLAEKYNIDDKIINQAIETNFEIAEKVNIEIPKYNYNYPKFCEDEEESIRIFRAKLKEKWFEKVEENLIPNDKLDIYKERLLYELKIIEDKKIVDYFLILDDMLNNFVFKVGGSVGAGRGSAGGSLVLFILDITKIDPIRHNLFFERFLSPMRLDYPDIDMDIDHITHKRVEDYLKTRWGEDKVCHVLNYTKFGSKTTVKDLCRVFELDYTLSNRLTGLFNPLKQLPIEEELKNASGIAEGSSDFELVRFINQNKQIFLKFGEKLNNSIRQIGRHASGIVVNNLPFTKSKLPIARLSGELITGIQEGLLERELSELGFLKLDILGLRTATINNETLLNVEQHYGLKNLEKEILKSNFDDKKVYEQFSKGNCQDIFQFGSESMISLMKRIKPKTIYDLNCINAVFRPAIIISGGVEEYVQNRKHPEKIKKELDEIHPELWSVLSESAGVPLFQESIMMILQKLGGFTLAESDKVRKLIKMKRKEDSDDVMNRFREGAAKNNVSKENIEKLINILVAYSEYSFNKCLSSDTKILTKNGYKFIKEFEEDDEVFSYDYETNEIYQTKVKKLHKNGRKKLYEITTTNGAKIDCTLDHKFMVEDGTMQSLQNILDNDLEIITVIDDENETIKFKKETLKELGDWMTYDLEIDDENHNFILNNGLVSSNSHSLAYSMNAYISMWLKVNYSIEYFATLLNYSEDEDINIIMKQCKEFKVKVNDCRYELSSTKFEVDYENNCIKFGLNKVKELRDVDMKILVKTHFRNRVELLRFITQTGINKRSIESLCRVGYFDNIIHKNRLFVEKLILYLKSFKTNPHLDDIIIKALSYSEKFKKYSSIEILKFEKSYIKSYYSEHPFLKVEQKLKEKGIDKFTFPKDVNSVQNEEEFQLIGILSDIIMLKSKKTGKEYYKYIIEDDKEEAKVTAFDVKDFTGIHTGDTVIIRVTKSNYGLTKTRNSGVQKIKVESEDEDPDLISDFESIIQRKENSVKLF